MGRRPPVVLLDPETRRRWWVGVQQAAQFHDTGLTGIGAVHDPAVSCRDHPGKSGAAQIDHQVPRADQPQIEIEPVAIISLLSQWNDAFDARGAVEQRTGEIAGDHRDPRCWKGIGQQPQQPGGQYDIADPRIGQEQDARTRSQGRKTHHAFTELPLPASPRPRAADGGSCER